ncbi:MAG: hypothetical protein REJ50_24170 [Bordetella sp.]|nr:hypothetical protein [Bordetella sp.]
MKLQIHQGKLHLQVDGAFTSEQLLELIHQISDARSQIASDPTSPVGVPLKLTATPAWHTEYNALAQSHVLCFLNGLGWQSFAISTLDASRIAGYLSIQIAGVLAAARQDLGATRGTPGHGVTGPVH